jgi:ATP phosphoribosyltransferase regulatory subunit
MADALKGLPVAPQTGDIGVLTAAVAGLGTSAARKAALLRHIWRPERFRRLIDRFSGRAPRGPVSGMSDAPIVGKRGRAEVAGRLDALRLDAAEPDLDSRGLEAVLDVSGSMTEAIDALSALVADLPTLSGAITRLSARAEALSKRGVDVSELPFATQFGRTSMEYYDGFVFAFVADGQPPAATGGRYDALTRRLGGGKEVPAVGGVLRPGVMAALEVSS